MSDAAYDDDAAAAPADDDDSHLPLEERARIRGWKPLEEFRGDPTKWRSAEEFMFYGQDPNVLAAENRRMGGRLHRVEGQLERLTKTSGEQMAAIDELRKLARRADQAGYNRARAELVEERRAAVETGDTSAFDQIEQRLTALDTERATVEAPAVPAQPVLDPSITTFQTQNRDWFVPGSELHKAMCAHFEIVERIYPERPVAQQLAIAKERTIKDFPARFPGQQMAPQPDDDDVDDEPAPRRRAPSVAAPAPPPRRPGRQQATGWDSIDDPAERAEAKAAFESIKRADPGMTEAEYLTIYNNPHADEIALRAARKP